MRRAVFVALLLFARQALAQPAIRPGGSGAATRFIRVASIPASCQLGDVFVDATVSPAVYYNCPSGVPAVFGGGISQAAADLRYLQISGSIDGAQTTSQTFTGGIGVGDSLNDGTLRVFGSAKQLSLSFTPGASANRVLAIDWSGLSANRTLTLQNASGTLALTSQLPANTTATATQFFTAYNSSTGAFTKAQPAFTDMSGAASSAQIPNNAADTTGKSAKTDALNSATTVVNVSSATAPSNGQVLTATGSTTATWQTPASSGANTALSNLASVAMNTTLVPAGEGSDAAPNYQVGATHPQTLGIYRGSNATFNLTDGTSPFFTFYATFNAMVVRSGDSICWANSSNSLTGSADTCFSRTAAGVATTGTSWLQGPGSCYVAADQTNATSTFASTTCSITVKTGRKYRFQCELLTSDSVSADGAKIDFNGGSATATDFRAQVTAFDSALNLSSQTTALATAAAATTFTGAGAFEVHGSFEPSANGTFIPRFAQNAHTTGTLTLFRGSNCVMTDMP